MAILKCKMCGGDILLSEDKTTGTCDHCGSTMTFPRVSDEQKLNLYNRANHFRRQNEFDKAITAYERILDQDDTDAEAHWGAVLSRYGIEYVEDPVTHERIPTCHRVQISSILSDGDYLAALENAPDKASRDLYEQEAHRIAEIQKGILSISSQEKPYDVFICYKETDDSGSRTKDSTLAQEIYYQLTNEGYKVFFSRITLEDKLGQQYEPYIFAALNSAKVMLVVGTKPEYFSAVWVKNEWSRYLALMKNDRSRLLIPCYRDMDPYDLPEELSALQSQDMSKIGFVQDLIRGVKKVLDSKKPAETKPAAPQVTATGANIENLMKRAYLFLEDGDFASANEYLDKVLDENAEYAPAYAGKVCTSLGFRKEEQLAEATFLYGKHPDWKKALRFASSQQKAVYEGYYEQVKVRVARQIRDYAYDCAVEMAVNPQAKRTELDNELEQYHIACDTEQGRKADGGRRMNALKNENQFRKAMAENDPGDISEQNYQAAAEMFLAIGDEEAVAQAKECDNLAEMARQKVLYLAEQTRQSDIYTRAANKSLQLMNAYSWEKLAEEFASIPDYKDALARAEKCREKAEAVRKELYDAAIKAMQEAGNDTWKWKAACEKLNRSDLVGYRDVDELRKQAAQRVKECEALEQEARRQYKLLAERQAAAAKKRKRKKVILLVFLVLLAIGGYFLATNVLIPKNNYQNALALQQAGKYEEAITAFEASKGYGDSAAQIKDISSPLAMKYEKEGKNAFAALYYAKAGNREKAVALWWEAGKKNAVAASYHHTVGLKADGTVVSMGSNEYGQCKVRGWTDIVAVAAGSCHTVGLKANGTVVAVGYTDDGRCNVQNWTDIVAVAAGSCYTVGLKANGTVVAVGTNNYDQCDVQGWTNIVDVAAGSCHTVGLKANGTVVAVGSNKYYQCDVQGWTNIVAVAAGNYHTVGLKVDGTVVATGDNGDGQCNVQGWTDIVAVAAGWNHTVGLKADGTVVAVGMINHGQCNVQGWTDIVAVAAGDYHTVGLNANGTVVAVGYNDNGQCDVQNWTDIKRQ